MEVSRTSFVAALLLALAAPRVVALPALPPTVTTATTTEACPAGYQREQVSQPATQAPQYTSPVTWGIGYWAQGSWPNSYLGPTCAAAAAAQGKGYYGVNTWSYEGVWELIPNGDSITCWNLSPGPVSYGRDVSCPLNYRLRGVNTSGQVFDGSIGGWGSTTLNGVTRYYNVEPCPSGCTKTHYVGTLPTSPVSGERYQFCEKVAAFLVCPDATWTMTGSTCTRATTTCRLTDPGASPCQNPSDAGPCTCTASAPVAVPVGGSKEQELGAIPCSGVEGMLSAKLQLNASGSQVPPVCANTCTMSGAVQGSVAVEASLCSKNKVTATALARYTLEKKHAPVCDPWTCSTGCSQGYCRTDDGSASLSLAHTRAFGMDVKEAFPGGKVFVKCGGTLATAADFGGGVREVSDYGAGAACPTCVSGRLSLSGGATATLNCSTGVEWSAGPAYEVGCQKCLTANVKLTGTVSSQAGGCGSANCSDVLASASLVGEMPKVKLGFKWWSVTGSCGVTVTGCSQANSCGTCTCGKGACTDLTPVVSCSICAGKTTLPACKKTGA